MPYKYTLWLENEPVIEMTMNVPNIDVAKFLTRNIHMDYMSNHYMPFSTRCTTSKLDYIEPTQ